MQRQIVSNEHLERTQNSANDGNTESYHCSCSTLVEDESKDCKDQRTWHAGEIRGCSNAFDSYVVSKLQVNRTNEGSENDYLQKAERQREPGKAASAIRRK